EAPRALTNDSWAQVAQGSSLVSPHGAAEHWDWLQASHYAQPTDRLRALAEEFRVTRRDDPLTLLREINSTIHRGFAYEPKSTRVDSPLDECLAIRRGVCQDFAHIFIALARLVRIPCRYVSGHLFHDRLARFYSAEGASHAWAEALLPEI